MDKNKVQIFVFKNYMFVLFRLDINWRVSETTEKLLKIADNAFDMILTMCLVNFDPQKKCF